MGVKGCFSILATAFACLVSGYGESEQNAVVSFGEIDRCAQSMTAAESYQDALAAYEKAVEAGELILSKYPASDVAKALTSGERKVGSLSWEKFQALKEPLQLSAAGEQDLTACALVVAETGEEGPYKYNILVNIAEYYADNEAYSKAEHLLSSALEFVPANTNVFSRAHTITRCAAVYHKIGEGERAASMRERAAEEWAGVDVEEQFDRRQMSSGFVDLSIVSFDAGEEEQGERLIALALQSIDETEEFRRQMELNDLASSLALAGYLDQALRILQEYVQESYSSMFLRYWMMGEYDDDQLAQLLTFAVAMEEGFERDSVIAELVIRYAERGQFVQASSIIKNWMGDSFYADQAWGSIAEQYVKMGKFNSAASSADQITDMDDKAAAFAGIAVACEEAGERELADELFLWAEGCIAAASYFPSQIDACCAVAEKYITAGKDVRAAGLLTRAAIAVGAPGNWEYRSRGHCATIARLLFRIDQDEFAHELLTVSKQWAAEAKDERERIDFFANIAEAYAQAGELQAALDALDSFEVDERDMEAVFECFAEHCIKNGDVTSLLEALSAHEDQIDFYDGVSLLSDFGYVDEILQLANIRKNPQERKIALYEAYDVCVEKMRFLAAVEVVAMYENPLDQAYALVNIAALASEVEYEFAQDELGVLSQIIRRALSMDAFWEKQGFCTSAD